MDDDGGDGDFTFPAPPPAMATATAMPPSRQEDGGLGLLWPARFPPIASSTLLWPFSTDDAVAKDAPAARHERDEEEEEEERMDKLWEHVRGDDEDGVDEERSSERMDMLWEDFNDELLLQLRRQRAGGDARPASSSSSSPEEEEASPPSSAGRGCAPTMLRASSRAGGVGQLYGRRHGRSRATTGWEILLRLFRKLFAVDKSSPPCSHHRRHGSIYVP